MRLKVKVKKKSIRYIVDLSLADIDNVCAQSALLKQMRKYDASNDPLKILESLLMKVRLIERSHPIIYKSPRDKKWRKK